MGLCYFCGEEVDFPHRCSYCNLSLCDKHRLPENHNCVKMPSRSLADKKAKGLISGTSRTSMIKASKHLEKSRSQWKETTNRWANEQRARNGGYKKHRKLGLLVKVLLVGLLLGGGSVLAWKSEVFSEEINQKFNTVATYLQGLWISITDLVTAEDLSETELESGPKPEPEPEPEPLKPFESVDDLIRFLDNDNVSDVVYASDFTCGDFAEALVNRAHDAGYDLNVYSMFDSELDDFKRYVETREFVTVEEGVTTITTFSYGFGSGHAVCETEIDTVVYVIEPQNDMVFEVIEDGYDIVYFGEVTK